MRCMQIGADGADSPGDIFGFFDHNCDDVCPNLEIPPLNFHLHFLCIQATVNMVDPASNFTPATSTTFRSARLGT